MIEYILRKFSNYFLKSKNFRELFLGTGTFGRVQLAKHRETDQYYALKSMYIPSIIAKHQVEHVHHEKRILEQLNHPFIVKM